jgi:outer membrane lipoprotein-sorting protein
MNRQSNARRIARQPQTTRAERRRHSRIAATLSRELSPRRTPIAAALSLALALALLLAAPIAAQRASSSGSSAGVPSIAEGRRILQRVDDLVTFANEDFSAEYTVTEVRPGAGNSRTTFVLFRRDRMASYTILIQEPAQDRGKGYLRIDDNLWLYDPAARRFTVVGGADRFQNTNARNSDFNRSTLASDFRITGVATEQLGAYATTVYDLEATHDDVTFPRMRIWIDEQGLVRKAEDYSLAGRHMRTTAIPDYRRLEDRFVPVQIVIQDELRGREVDGQFRNERTLITVRRESLQTLPDMVFTRTFLERAGN